MHRLIKIVLFFGLCVGGSAAWANSYSDTIKVFSDAGESGKYFKTSYGYALFPIVGKGGCSSSAEDTVKVRYLLTPNMWAIPL